MSDFVLSIRFDSDFFGTGSLKGYGYLKILKSSGIVDEGKTNRLVPLRGTTHPFMYGMQGCE